MAGLVFEIQSAALNDDVPVTKLVRMTNAAASNLRLNDIRDWTSKELNGYPSHADLPPYRILRGEVKAWNPMLRTWIPIYVQSDKKGRLNERRCAQEISALEGPNGEVSDGTIRFPIELQRSLMSGLDVPLEPVLYISSSTLRAMLSTIRQKILDWSLELESNGIPGEGMSFTPEEQETAQRMTTNITGAQHVTIVSGNSGSKISTRQSGGQSCSLADVASVVANIEDALGAFEPQIRNEIASTLKEIKSEMAKERVDEARVFEWLTSIRNIAESSVAGVASAGVTALIRHLLGSQ